MIWRSRVQERSRGSRQSDEPTDDLPWRDFVSARSICLHRRSAVRNRPSTTRRSSGFFICGRNAPGSAAGGNAAPNVGLAEEARAERHEPAAESDAEAASLLGPGPGGLPLEVELGRQSAEVVDSAVDGGSSWIHQGIGRLRGCPRVAVSLWRLRQGRIWPSAALRSCLTPVWPAYDRKVRRQGTDARSRASPRPCRWCVQGPRRQAGPSGTSNVNAQSPRVISNGAVITLVTSRVKGPWGVIPSGT